MLPHFAGSNRAIEDPAPAHSPPVTSNSRMPPYQRRFGSLALAQA